MIRKKLETLKRNTKEKDIGHNPGIRKGTRNRGTKSRRVGQRRQNGQPTRPIQ